MAKKKLLPLLTADVNADPTKPRANPRKKTAKPKAPKAAGKLRVVQGWVA